MVEGPGPDAEPWPSRILQFVERLHGWLVAQPGSARHRAASEKRLRRAAEPTADLQRWRKGSCRCCATQLSTCAWRGSTGSRRGRAAPRATRKARRGSAKKERRSWSAGAGSASVDPQVRRARDKKTPTWSGIYRASTAEASSARKASPSGIPWFPLAGIATASRGSCRSGLLRHARRHTGGRRSRPGGSPASTTSTRSRNAFRGVSCGSTTGVLRDGRIGPASTYTELEPLDNSLVFFPSELFHEVCPVRADGTDFLESRFTVNIWYRAEELPAIQRGTARRHVGVAADYRGARS